MIRRATEPISAATDSTCCVILALAFMIAAVGALTEGSAVLSAVSCFAAAGMLSLAAWTWRRG